MCRVVLLSVVTVHPADCKHSLDISLLGNNVPATNFCTWLGSDAVESNCLQIILLVGTKLQVIITKMGLRIHERGEVVKGVPVVQPGDDLFWFNRPRLILYLINFVLFQVL